MEKLISINADSAIFWRPKETFADLFIDGTDCFYELYQSRIDVVKELYKHLCHYRDDAKKLNKSISIDLYNVSLTIKEKNDFSSLKEELSNSFVANRFRFLENNPYFYRKLDSDLFYIYQFQGEEDEFGEIQLIYIGIPKSLKRRMDIKFKTVKNGECIRFISGNFPHWFENLYEKAVSETSKMYKLRRLFLEKQPI